MCEVVAVICSCKMCFYVLQHALQPYLCIPVTVTAVTYWFTDSEAAFRHRSAGGRICCIIHVPDWYKHRSVKAFSLAKDTRGAAATKCQALKFFVWFFISYSAHGDLTAVWYRAQESGRSQIRAALPHGHMTTPGLILTSCNYVALLKCLCQGSRRVGWNLLSALVVASVYDLLSISCLWRLTAHALEAWLLRFVLVDKSGHRGLFWGQTTEQIFCLFVHADLLWSWQNKMSWHFFITDLDLDVQCINVVRQYEY